MPHTKSRYQQDLGYEDAILFISPWTAVATEAGGAPGTDVVLTRNGQGDISLNQVASKTIIYDFNLGDTAMFRTGASEDLQEQYGGTGIAGSAEYQGRPDTLSNFNFSGGALGMSKLQEITPRTAFKVKGIRVISIAAIYQTFTNALTAITCRFDKSVFSNNVVIVKTSIIATGANGLSTAVQSTGPSVTEIVLPTAQQIYLTSDLSEYWFEMSVQTAANCTFQLYGVRFKCHFNFN